MFPTDIQDFASLPNKDSKFGRRWFFTITAPSDDDIGKLLDAWKNNTLTLLCCYKVVDDMKVPYLQGGLIFKEQKHNQTWLKYHLCSQKTWFLMKGYENQIVQHCTKDFNQGKDNITLIYDDGFTKKSIPVKISEENTALTQLLTEDKTIYEICENYPQIYETYYEVLKKITLERDFHKEREIPEVAWIYGLPGSGKTEFAQDCLKTYDIMRKKTLSTLDFVVTKTLYMRMLQTMRDLKT
jgi:hypothetical protein